MIVKCGVMVHLGLYHQQPSVVKLVPSYFQLKVWLCNCFYDNKLKAALTWTMYFLLPTCDHCDQEIQLETPPWCNKRAMLAWKFHTCLWYWWFAKETQSWFVWIVFENIGAILCVKRTGELSPVMTVYFNYMYIQVGSLNPATFGKAILPVVYWIGSY